MICANHQCRTAFEPSYKGQRYCCRKCKYAERNWRKTVGERVMSAAIEGCDTSGMVRAAVSEWLDARR